MRGISKIADPGGSAIIRKSPVTDFASGSILQVPPGCKALVDINGRLLLFEPGAHELQTGLNPIFSGLQTLKSKGIPTISAHVYFFNVDRYFNIEFCTEEVIVTDLATRLPIHIAGYGILRIKIQNPEKLFKLLHGNGVMYTTQMLSEFLMSEISPAITELLAEQCSQEPFITVASRLSQHDALLTRLVQEKLNECGLSLERATLTKIFPREDEMQGITDLIRAIEQGKIPTTVLEDKIRRIFGGDIDKAMMFELMEKFASSSSGNGMNPMMWPMMMQMNEMFMNQMQPMMQRTGNMREARESQIQSPNVSPTRKGPRVVSSTGRDGTKRCGQCGAVVDVSDTFCPYCDNALF